MYKISKSYSELLFQSLVLGPAQRAQISLCPRQKRFATFMHNSVADIKPYRNLKREVTYC